MDAQTYLFSLLHNSSRYILTDQDVSIIAKKGMRGYILAKLLSKQHRKWRIDPNALRLTEEAVSQALAHQQPLKVFFAQGSYKLWRVASAPQANWAEFFNIAYMISYLAPIVAAYKPGVQLTYYFLTVLPETHNNLSREEVDAYSESFQSLLSEFTRCLPANFRVVIEKDLDTYQRPIYKKVLEKAKVVADKQFYAWPVTKQEDYFRRAQLNIKWDGKEDLTKLTELEKQGVIARAVLYEYAATQNILMKDKLSRGVILSTFSREDSIGIGSTSTSIVKHWVGVGVLEKDIHGYHPRILSPSQYERAQLMDSEVVPVKVISGNMFKIIEVYPRHFDFSRQVRPVSTGEML